MFYDVVTSRFLSVFYPMTSSALLSRETTGRLETRIALLRIFYFRNTSHRVDWYFGTTVRIVIFQKYRRAGWNFGYRCADSYFSKIISTVRLVILVLPCSFVFRCHRVDWYSSKILPCGLVFWIPPCGLVFFQK
jgi:hypothetical protein